MRTFSSAGGAKAGTGSGGAVKSEDDPLDPAPVPSMRQTLAAIRHLEDAVTGADWTVGIVLRYGGFYGPGTSLAADGEHAEMVRRRKFPVVGDGAGVNSVVNPEKLDHLGPVGDMIALLRRPPS